MTLYKGRHLIGMNQQRDEKGEYTGTWEPSSPDAEVHLEYEIADLGASLEYDADGQHEIVWAKLRKVR